MKRNEINMQKNRNIYEKKKRTIYVEDQESDKCCSSKVNNIQRSGGDSSRLSVCSRQMRKKKRRRGTSSYSYTHTGSIAMNVNGSVLFFSSTCIYTYICILPMGWKEKKTRERCSVRRKRPWFRRSLEVVTRLLIAQKEQPTCMCVCDNDTVKINKTLYSR